MRVTIRMRDDDEIRDVVADDSTATVQGKCPVCDAEPFVVAGRNCRRGEDDRSYVSVAYCLGCDHYVGVLIADMSDETIFGLGEDELIASGRYGRVY